MAELLYRWWREDDGQDLIEYSLLLVFIVVMCAGLMGSGTPAIQGIVSTSNSQLIYANGIASGG